MKIKIPFNGPAYESSSKFASFQECVNMYLKPWPEMGEKALMLVGVPGLTEWTDLSGDEIRGFVAAGGLLFVVKDDTLYSIDTSKNATEIGTIDTSSGPVSMETNGIDVILVDGQSGYTCTVQGTDFNEIDDGDFPFGCNSIGFLDGYYLANLPGTGQIWRSDWNDGTSWEALAFSTAGGQPDDVVAIAIDHKDAWALGEYTGEVFYNTGVGTFNFASISGAFAEIGATSPYGHTKINNALYWVGRDENGLGYMVQALGRAVQIISNSIIESKFSEYDLSSAIAFSYSMNGHNFVVVTFKDDNATWVYDSTTSNWHKRSSRINGDDKCWRAGCHVIFDNQHIVGDLFSGKLYVLDEDTNEEDGEPIIAVRTTPVIREKQSTITIDCLHILTEPGVGRASGDVQDIDPYMLVSWSKDGGYTWSYEVDVPLGKIGEYKNRATVRQLGQGDNWVIKIRISADVKRVILGAIAEVTVDD